MSKTIFISICLCICSSPAFTQIISRILRPQSQLGQMCNTLDNNVGICTALSNCSSLAAVNNDLLIVQQFKLRFLRRNCGNQIISLDPVVCCKQKTIQSSTSQPQSSSSLPTNWQDATMGAVPTDRIFTSPPYVENVTSTTVTTNTSTTTTISPIMTTTQISIFQPTPEARANVDCFSPERIYGTCKGLKDCPVLLNVLINDSKNQTVINYLRQSNELCEGRYQEVCCPLEDSSQPPVTFSPVTLSPNTRSSRITELFVNRLPTIEDGCGVANNSYRRIVGGVEAPLGSWPWAVLLGYEGTNGIEFKCGGSLITQRHILTAAHCIRNELKVVRLGEHDLSTDKETEHIDIPIARMEAHPEYSRRDGFSDIAILYMERSVEFTKLIKPVCLPRSATLRFKSYVDYSPFVVGWGRLQEGGSTAEVLQQLQIAVYDNTVCIEQYNQQAKYLSERQFGESVLCSGYLKGGKDTCQGDSGGPLMIPETIGRSSYFYQIGVVSYGIGCARPNTLGVYTSVQYFMDWIEEKVTDTR